MEVFSNNKKKIHIIFILPNIYEIVNGVSMKYIKFLEYLSSQTNLIITVFLTRSKKKNVQLPSFSNIQFIVTSGLRVPYYSEIKVPIFTNKNILLQEIKTQKEIIIFHGEFIWLYETLQELKMNHPNIHIFPNWHTDYEYYLDNVYQLFSLHKSFIHKLEELLTDKIFQGILVTGPKMIQRYQTFTQNIFNANEIDLSIYKNFKMDNYLSKRNVHFIYTGRISKEKNIEESLSLLYSIKSHFLFQFHIIGDGPFRKDLEKIVLDKYPGLNIHFYGRMSSQEIYKLYMELENRIFIFTSTSETFGKTPFEAAVCGIPCFIKRSDITEYIYEDMENSFLFDNLEEFINKMEIFWNWDSQQKLQFIQNSRRNTLQYDQTVIFENWKDFLLEKSNLLPPKSQLFQNFTFYSLTKFIQCSNNIFGEN